ncbi:MAG: PASTA domain-containing protein [Actinomycetota bacterium]|nr:PASTA domain-containing protein [Actinomycetota bacterium]
MDTTMLDPVVGRVLERRYRVERRLARGGMSTVYEGTDLRLDRRVAIKVMAEALASDPAFIASFIREARSAARLAHLNVVSVSDQGEDGGLVFLVMELVLGQTLREVIYEQGRLAPAQAFAVLAPTLSGLSAAHRTGLIHRDVKPENILLSSDGLVKVADFGLARAVADTGTTSVTNGVLLGTVAYLAPEQIERGKADARSDVYAAGIVLYEMLTGRPPYSGDSALSVAYQHVNNDVPLPSRTVPTIPVEIDELVSSATRRDPAARPLDAGAFLAELFDVSADLGMPRVTVPVRGVSTAPPGQRRHPSGGDVAATSPHHSRAPRGHRTAVLATAANGSLTSGRIGSGAGAQRVPPGPTPGLPGPTSSPVHDRRLSGSSSSTRRRRRTGSIVLALVLVLAAVAGGIGWWFGSGRYTVAPNVVGMAQSAAVAAVQDAGLDPVVEEVFSETVAADNVISADPEAGAEIVRGSMIELQVSKGPERFFVDAALIGQPEAAVSTALAALPIVVLRAEDYHDTVPAGSVAAFDPAPGAELRRDQQITMVVSLGPAPREIPTVAGTTRADAEAALTTLGFVVDVREDFNSDVVAGIALGTEPAPDAGPQPFGATIVLVVSKGPDLVAVPNVIGKDRDTAIAELQAAGFVAEPTSFLGNRVCQQSPAANELAERGSTVSILLSFC